MADEFLPHRVIQDQLIFSILRRREGIAHQTARHFSLATKRLEQFLSVTYHDAKVRNSSFNPAESSNAELND